MAEEGGAGCLLAAPGPWTLKVTTAQGPGERKRDVLFPPSTSLDFEAWEIGGCETDPDDVGDRCGQAKWYSSNPVLEDAHKQM